VRFPRVQKKSWPIYLVGSPCEMISSFPSPWKPTRLFSNIHRALSGGARVRIRTLPCSIRINQSSRFCLEQKRNYQTTSRAFFLLAVSHPSRLRDPLAASKKCAKILHLFAKTIYAKSRALETLLSSRLFKRAWNSPARKSIFLLVQNEISYSWFSQVMIEAHSQIKLILNRFC